MPSKFMGMLGEVKDGMAEILKDDGTIIQVPADKIPQGAEMGQDFNVATSKSGQAVVTPMKPPTAPKVSSSSVYNEFMGVIKQKITNPFGLAAVAATGSRESRYSPKNVNRTWSDPSVSGKAGTSGGIMSWRGSRLSAMQQFAKERGGATPAVQAEFFLQENPGLVDKLNNAKSAKDAITQMNNAWKFAGYKDGPEAQARFAETQKFLPQIMNSVSTSPTDSQGGSMSPESFGELIGMNLDEAIDPGSVDSSNKQASASESGGASSVGNVIDLASLDNQQQADEARSNALKRKMNQTRIAAFQQVQGALPGLPALPTFSDMFRKQ